VQGESPLGQVLDAVFLGDLVSYYLALLYDVSPSPVEAIDKLKARLSG
jgi:glucose/mannose-6-phosphate isomerase